MAEKYLKVFEVANILRVDEETVRRWCRDGLCPHFRFEGIIRIPSSWIEIKVSGKAIMDKRK